MTIKIFNSANNLNNDWDSLTSSTYQKKSFLEHLENTNPCNQRYYVLLRENELHAGAVVYSLAINLFTFSKLSLKLPMQVIGIPLSCDAQGVIGYDEDVNFLISHILQIEKGLVLGLNYEQHLSNSEIIHMRTLPSMIFIPQHTSWSEYLKAVRHPYRRRISQAQKSIDGISVKSSNCQYFTTTHYIQYLEVISRSKTRLETLNLDFFQTLPSEYILNSYYNANTLIYWHIVVKDNECYSFLFGGYDYQFRSEFHSYLNNLIAILQDGILLNCTRINLGQTAEVAKARLGAIPEEKALFLYHKNALIRWGLGKFRRLLSYADITEIHNVYKSPINSMIFQNQYQYAKSP